MILNLNLPYRIRSGDEWQFLEPFEVDEVNRLVAEAQAQLPANTMDVQRLQVSRDVRAKFLADPGVGSSIPRRISAFLFRTAVEFRYRKEDGRGGFRIEIPRKDANKTKPGVWYGQLTRKLSDYPDQLELSAQIAVWLVATWEDDKVQNGFAPAAQDWVNTLDEEFVRLLYALNGGADWEEKKA